jgi:hypothetical protein
VAAVPGLRHQAPDQIPSAVANGSSKAVRLNKISSVHDWDLPLGTLAFSGPRIKPFLRSSPPPSTAPPGPFYWTKRPLNTTRHTGPRPRPTLTPEPAPRIPPLATGDDSSRIATTDPSDPRLDPVTSLTSTPLMNAHSDRLPGPEADSSDPGCSARGTSAAAGPGSPS